MAAKKSSDLHYHTPTLTRWFALGSLALVVSIVWMILADHRRPWKRFQEEFQELDRSRTEAAIAAAESEIPAQDMEQLQARLQDAQARFAEQQRDYAAARAALRAAEDRLFRADQRWRNAKAYQATLRYEYEIAAVEQTHDRDELAAEYQRWNDEVAAAVNEVQESTEARDEAQSVADTYTAEIGTTEKEIDKLREQVERLETKLDSLVPNFATQYILNEPVLDIMAPTLKIRQVVVTGIDQDLHYTEVNRVDRCMTCHMPIDRAGYDDTEEPFRSHPQLDKFVGATSPHPMETFGCSTCHFGRDRSVDFTRSVHWPDSHEEEEEWKEKYDWHHPTHWDFPMLPKSYIDATCFKCHMEQDRVPGSEDAAQAEDFYEVFGCFGCHKAKGYEDLRKVGPSLENFASKSPDKDWTYRWLEAPRAFRAKTRMPHFWNLDNNSTARDVPYNHAEIRGITEYIYAKSTPVEFPALPGRGDAARGKELVENTGCLGCHVVGDDPADQVLSRLDRRRFGPTLDGIGSKATPEWIYAWVKDPRAYWPETRMPDLRLTEQEALDITAYLVTLRDDDFMRSPIPSPERSARDEILTEFYRNTMTEAGAATQLASMSEDEKWEFMGQRSIAKYGCYGCHDIPGFEDANPIGIELSEEGSKSVHLFDFGYEHIPHTRHDWISQKLRSPRIFDRGKVKNRGELLKMPSFGFTDEEARIGTMSVLSFTKDRISEEMRKTLDARETALEAGRELVRQRNCRGCHELEGQGRDIEQALLRVFEGQGMATQEASTQADAFSPPLITIEGAKVEPDWLFEFFKEPSTIRTWLNVRMPSFHFTDEEINTLITYFNALSNETYPFETYPDIRMTPVQRAAADKLVSPEYLDCFKCHARGDSGTIAGAGSAAEWAPDLSLSYGRLKPDWIDAWIRDPQGIQPGTRMPTYFDIKYFDQTGAPDILDGDENAQIDALVKWVLSLGNPGGAKVATGAR